MGGVGQRPEWVLYITKIPLHGEAPYCPTSIGAARPLRDANQVLDQKSRKVLTSTTEPKYSEINLLRERYHILQSGTDENDTIFIR